MTHLLDHRSINAQTIEKEGETQWADIPSMRKKYSKRIK